MIWHKVYRQFYCLFFCALLRRKERNMLGKKSNGIYEFEKITQGIGGMEDRLCDSICNLIDLSRDQRAELRGRISKEIMVENHIRNKRKNCLKIYQNYIGDWAKRYPFSKFYNQIWEQESFSCKEVKRQMQEKIHQFQLDLVYFKSKLSETEFDSAEKIYHRCMNREDTLKKMSSRTLQAGQYETYFKLQKVVSCLE